jgi:hypothetical protein
MCLKNSEVALTSNKESVLAQINTISHLKKFLSLKLGDFLERKERDTWKTA